MGTQEARLGILGGMGPQATQIFYQRIIDRTQAERDQEHVPTLIWSDTQIPDRTASILSGNGETVYDRLRSDARLLEQAGCTIIAIPCNTSHYFVERLGTEVQIPILNMIKETVRRIREGGTPKVGILATDGTVQMGLYQKECERAGLCSVVPPEDIQKLVMSVIYDEIKRGEPGSREKFSQIDRAMRDLGCDCVILGCTELSVYRTYHNLPAFYVDAMEVLAECAIIHCGKKLRNI
jgi:aspartate racemase